MCLPNFHIHTAANVKTGIFDLHFEFSAVQCCSLILSFGHQKSVKELQKLIFENCFLMNLTLLSFFLSALNFIYTQLPQGYR